MTFLFGRREYPEPEAPSRKPAESRVNTVTVACARTGPEDVDGEGYTYRPHALADIEAWCAELRRLGAGDNLALPEADGLVVTMDAA